MNNKSSLRVYASAVTIGIIAGMRSMLAPQVAVSIGAVRHPAVKTAAALLAGAELVADKLPFTPNRTAPGPLTGRLLAGSICGAALCASQDRSKLAGAILGAAGAFLSTFAAYEIRKRLTERRYLPASAIALLEDGIAVGSAKLLTRSFTA